MPLGEIAVVQMVRSIRVMCTNVQIVFEMQTLNYSKSNSRLNTDNISNNISRRQSSVERFLMPTVSFSPSGETSTQVEGITDM